MLPILCPDCGRVITQVQVEIQVTVRLALKGHEIQEQDDAVALAVHDALAANGGYEFGPITTVCECGMPNELIGCYDRDSTFVGFTHHEAVKATEEN